MYRSTASNEQLEQRSSYHGSSLKAFLGDALPSPIRSFSDSVSSFALSSSSSSHGSENFAEDTNEEEGGAWDKYEDARLNYFEHIIKNWDDQFALRKDDVQVILDDDVFHDLQKSLRRRGCVTNTFLQQKVHQYIYKQRMKKKQQKREKKNTAVASASTT